MDLLDEVLDNVESGNDSNERYFKNLSIYTKNKTGSVEKNQLKLYGNSQYLKITQENEKIFFELYN